MPNLCHTNTMGRILGLSLGIFTLIFSTFVMPAQAQSDLPKEASLKRSEVYVRSGPGTRYPILWVFQRKGWPVALLNKYDNWFKIRDVEGEEGWVYVGMISHKATATISPGEPALLSKKPNGEGAIFRLSPMVIVDIEDCPQTTATDTTCKISYDGKVGYITPNRLLRSQIK